MADVIGRAVIEIVPDFSLFRKEMAQTVQALTREMSQQLAKADVAAPLAKTFGEAGKKASDNLLAATGKAFTEVAADASKAHKPRRVLGIFALPFHLHLVSHVHV
jgi:hypothetical protein